MEPGAGHISVWVGQEEKIIYGLTKHTSSMDVVQALLEEQQSAMGKRHVPLSNSKEYSIMEKWRGFQCTLPPTTKMLKLCKAWGAEQVNVSFYLVKSELMQLCLLWNNAEYLKHTNYPHYSAASAIKSLPLHKQKSIVRKAFRKLAEMKKGTDSQEKNSIKKLMQLIASQDLTIKKQIKRMQELDEQIEECITYLHQDKEGKSEHTDHCSHLNEVEFKQQRCKFLKDTDSLGELLSITDEAHCPYMHTETLSNEIKEKPHSMPTCKDLLSDQENLKDNWEMCMLQCLRQTVGESLQLEVKLHSLLSCIQKEIHYKDSVLLSQKREYDVLKQELRLLNEPNNLVTYEFSQPYSISSSAGSEELDNITVALSITNMQSDSDSDTGISSIHSLNSDPVP